MHLCYEHQHSSGSERRVNRGRSSSLSPIRHSRFVAPPSFCATLIHLPAVPSLHSRYKSFIATTAALTPVCSGSSGLPSMNSGSFHKQVSLIHSSRLPDHSVSTHHDAPLSPLYHATPQLDSFPFTGLDFAFGWQARRLRPAVSSSLSYGLVVHLLLLPTTHHCVAVAFGYRSESVSLERTSTSLTTRAFRRTIPRYRARFCNGSHFKQTNSLLYGLPRPRRLRFASRSC